MYMTITDFKQITINLILRAEKRRYIDGKIIDLLNSERIR